MLTYDMDARGDATLYEYLYRRIRDDILAGELRAGERLPSKRQLAAHLRISVITVEAAYAQLQAEGYLRAVEKRGYFVEAVERATPVAPAALFPPTEEKAPAWYLDLVADHLRAQDFPFSAWARLTRSVLLDEGERLLEPVPYNGTEALRGAIAAYLRRSRGLSVDPAQIVVGAGTEYLYGLLVQLLGRERLYLLETPGYPKIGAIYRLNGASCRSLPVDGQGLCPDTLPDDPTAVAHLSPAHHFPSGAVMPIARRQALLRWAEGGDRYLIEDDYDSEFRMTGRPVPTLMSADTAGRVIFTNTFSKSIAPSLRIAYAVLPPALAARYREKCGVYACTVPSMEQYTLARFLETGGFERHLARMKTVYRLRRDAVIAAVEGSRFARLCTVRESDAGLHFLLVPQGRRTARTIADIAATVGIRLACLSDYGETDEDALVINYSGVDPDRLSEAVTRMEGALNMYDYPAHIARFSDEIGFPAEAKEALLAAYAAMEGGDLSRLVADYDADRAIDHPAALAAVHAEAETRGVPWQTAELLLYVCFARRLRERYAERGLDDALYLRAMDDLRCKLWECRRVQGVWGSFVAFWFCRFFDMTRFALGRLQYEPDLYDGPTYTVEGGVLRAGDPVLNVHIPSSGPLYTDEVTASLAAAKTFFADHFGEHTPICICHSWLLQPALIELLPPDSRIVRFRQRFSVVRVDPDPAFGDCFRLYDQDYAGDPSVLPRDTTFRRRFAEYLEAGGVPAEGFGILKL